MIACFFAKANSLEWSRLIDILDIYERASRQRLNKEKTFIHLSTNTSSESKEIIISIERVRSSSSYEKYLDLLALVGNSQTQAFKSIFDRVRSKINIWKTKFFSQVSNEILFKSMIKLCLHTVWMFLSSQDSFSKKSIVMNNYWWGQH